MLSACLACMAASACFALMAAIVVVDITMRIIPRKLCWALGACGCSYQLIACGIDGVAAGAVCAGALLAAMTAAVLVLGRRAGKEIAPIGGGDMRCMVALSLASGCGALVGALACFCSAAIWSAIARLRGRLLPGEPFAFAPFLAVWLVLGFVFAT